MLGAAVYIVVTARSCSAGAERAAAGGRGPLYRVDPYSYKVAQATIERGEKAEPSLQGVRNELNYIRGMGVETLLLSPFVRHQPATTATSVTPEAGDTAAAGTFAWDASLGSAEDLAQVVDDARALGLGVVVEVDFRSPAPLDLAVVTETVAGLTQAGVAGVFVRGLDEVAGAGAANATAGFVRAVRAGAGQGALLAAELADLQGPLALARLPALDEVDLVVCAVAEPGGRRGRVEQHAHCIWTRTAHTRAPVAPCPERHVEPRYCDCARASRSACVRRPLRPPASPSSSTATNSTASPTVHTHSASISITHSATARLAQTAIGLGSPLASGEVQARCSAHLACATTK